MFENICVRVLAMTYKYACGHGATIRFSKGITRTEADKLRENAEKNLCMECKEKEVGNNS